MSLSTPVLFLTFNRPETTSRVFEQIARARPSTLLLVSDGPRPDREGERERVEATRALVQQVDWPCEVLTDFSDINMGCKDRIASALAWTFGLVEEAIVLEDDCLPDPSFFDYCEQLLDHYRDDRRVMAITGNNFQAGQSRTPHSYYFSKYFHCWGWATWRRAWESFDRELTSWPEFQATGALASSADSRPEEEYWDRIFTAQHEGKICSWAYPFQYSCWAQSGLTVTPNVNLVSNIGFGPDATHTTNDSPQANVPVQSIGELRHPPLVVRNKAADRYTFATCYQRPPRLRRLQRKIQRYVLSRPRRSAA